MKTTLAIICTLLLAFAISHPVFAETVNLNKADAATLQANLQGIGPKKAQAIVDYRKKNGSFKSIDDLANVTGIGAATIKKNKKSLSLTKGATKTAKASKAKASQKASAKTDKAKQKAKDSKKAANKKAKDAKAKSKKQR